MRAVGRLVVALLAVVVGLAGCGIPTDDAPRVIADETSVPAVSTMEPGTVSVSVVLVVSETNELVVRERSVAGEHNPATALAALLMTPSEEETTDGLTTFVPPTAIALSLTEDDDGVWVVDMNSDWGMLQGQSALYAYAQVVLTLDRAGVERVRFTVDGEPVADAPTDTQGPKEVLTADDYAALAPG